nr:transglycosylase SLT domain-containing protein [uncultured Dethiosulfovibrio sp.]
MKKVRSVLLRLIAVILLLCLSSQGQAYSGFKGSSSWKYMESHRSRKYAKARVAVMSHYFRTKNPALSEKAAGGYASLVDAISRKYKLDPFLVSSIIVKESTVRVKAKSGVAYGLMQVNWRANRSWIPRVFPTVKSPARLLRSRANIYVGSYILREAMQRSGGDVDRALDIYRGKNVPSYRDSIHRYYSEQVGLLKKRLGR